MFAYFAYAKANGKSINAMSQHAKRTAVDFAGPEAEIMKLRGFLEANMPAAALASFRFFAIVPNGFYVHGSKN